MRDLRNIEPFKSRFRNIRKTVRRYFDPLLFLMCGHPGSALIFKSLCCSGHRNDFFRKRTVNRIFQFFTRHGLHKIAVEALPEIHVFRVASGICRKSDDL